MVCELRMHASWTRTHSSIRPSIQEVKQKASGFFIWASNIKLNHEIWSKGTIVAAVAVVVEKSVSDSPCRSANKDTKNSA